MRSLTHPIGQLFQPILDFFGTMLAFFFSIIPNYPIDVTILTLVIMALLTPLTVKSTKNMAAMQALGPEMKKLQQKYKGPENRAQLNEEMMALYKEHKVNPASGCLPMLLQMPVFFILYSVIKGITNTVAKGAQLPYTVVGNTIDTSTGSKCAKAACSLPRYLGTNTKMYQHIVLADGKLVSFGMDFSEKLLTRHSSIWVAIPYALLVICSVGLQYLQMARLNARNPQAAQANPQAAAIQKYMPLIFGVIYINVAAILNVYFIVSSAVRILTQEILFRRGLAGGAPAVARGVIPAKGTVTDKASAAEKPAAKAKEVGGAKAPATPAAKAHPRSKDKKDRKPRVQPEGKA